MPPTRRPASYLLAAAAMIAPALVGGCDGSNVPPTLPQDVDALTTDVDEVVLVSERGEFRLTNAGARTVGPVEFSISDLVGADGLALQGVALEADPGFVPTLPVGVTTTVGLRLAGNASAAAGRYSATLEARVDGRTLATVRVVHEVAADDPRVVDGIRLTMERRELRQGDAEPVGVQVLGAGGVELDDFTPLWRTHPAGAGLVADGYFHPYSPGEVLLIARAGIREDTVATVVRPREVSGTLELVNPGAEETRYTSDVWVHGGFAYTGTWGLRRSGDDEFFGNTLSTWDVGGSPFLVSQITVDARVVNDVKVREDGTLAVITHEGSNDGRNGFTILDLSTPSEPTAVSRFTTSLEPGVHNVFIDGDWLYVVVDGAGGLRVMDISDPAAPRIAAQYYAGDSFLHDVHVRDGLAFLSHWAEGMIVLDVGAGVAGGSPENPVVVAHVDGLGGETHNAWYWPESGYLFVGEEDYSTPGKVRVIDLSDLSNPSVVADFEMPSAATPHNFWLDEETGTLLVAWYEAGMVAIDVTGRLAGELDRQGRLLDSLSYSGTGVCVAAAGTCAWGPQLVGDRLFVSDMNSGLVELRWTRD